MGSMRPTWSSAEATVTWSRFGGTYDVDKQGEIDTYPQSLDRIIHGHLVAGLTEGCGVDHGHLVAQTYI
jgi:hypothetical protein